MNRKTRVIPIFSKPSIISTVLIFTFATLLTACTLTPPSQQEIREAEFIPQPSETSTPAPTSTATPTQTATSAPFYQVNEPDGPFSPQQEALINSPSAIKQIARIKRWLDYWIKFDNRPFAQDSIELNLLPTFDNVLEPTEVAMFLYAGGEGYGGKIFTSPLGDGVFAEFPPEYDGGEIETGFGPLELSAGAEGQVLSVQDGIPVRRDAKGQIVEKLDMVKGLWIKVEKYSIDLEKLHTMPSSYEDVVANPEKYQQSPDFFGDTKKAMEWWNNVLIPAMGDPRELEPNILGVAFMNRENRFDINSMGYEKALLSDYPSFYFFHGNELFLVPILALKDGNGITSSAFAVILYASNDGYIGNEGLAAVKNMAEGKKILNVVGIKNPGPFNLPDSVKSFIEGDYNWNGLEEYAMTGAGYLIGVGAITTILN
jgi:hypothetical protein